MESISKSFLGLIATMSLSTPALEATRTSAQLIGGQIQKLNCAYDGQEVNLDTGKRVPDSQSRYAIAGHNLTWTDGGRSFVMLTGQLSNADIALPELSQDEITTTAGDTANLKKETHDKRLFTVAPDYSTTLTETSTQLNITTISATESLTVDVSGDQAKRNPDMKTVTTPVAQPANSRKAVTTAEAALPASDGFQYKTWTKSCIYSPSSLKDMGFSGFFAKVKARILSFDKVHAATLVAERALSDCLTAAAGDAGNCVDLNAKSLASVQAREKSWKSLIQTSDLVEEPPAPDTSGDSGGYNGGSSTVDTSPSGTTICSGNVCSGPGGTTICSGNVCTGPGGTTVCSGNVCSGPGGTTICSGNVCSGPGGTTICSGNVCSGPDGGAMCGAGVSCP